LAAVGKMLEFCEFFLKLLVCWRD